MANDQAQKVDADQRGQFELAGGPLTESVRDFDDVQTATAERITSTRKS